MAYRSLELEGAFSPSRSDWIATNTAYLTELLVTSKGVKYQDLEKVFRTGALLMKCDYGKTKEELEAEEARETEAFFDSLCETAALNPLSDK